MVKIEKEPFTHGAKRFCFRSRKLAAPPKDSSNRCFHSYGWSRASDYVAKSCTKDGKIDTSKEAKEAVRNDNILQYETNHWAKKFNAAHPPRKIVFSRAYAFEFSDREGQQKTNPFKALSG